MDSSLTDMLTDYFEAHGQLAKQLHEASSYICMHVLLQQQLDYFTNSYVQVDIASTPLQLLNIAVASYIYKKAMHITQL